MVKSKAMAVKQLEPRLLLIESLEGRTEEECRVQNRRTSLDHNACLSGFFPICLDDEHRSVEPDPVAKTEDAQGNYH